MHYWIGTTFKVPFAEARNQGPRSIHDKAVIKNKSLFKSDVEYQLHFIQPQREGDVVYQFKETRTGEDLHIRFESTKHADEYIAMVTKDVLPDYEDFYRREGR